MRSALLMAVLIVFVGHARAEELPKVAHGTGTYGFGFNVGATPLRVGHGGGAPGVNAEIALYPDFGWQLIALANRDPPVASQMVTVLEKALFATDPESACANALADPQRWRLRSALTESVSGRTNLLPFKIHCTVRVAR